jgi:hypothetical protein
MLFKLSALFGQRAAQKQRLAYGRHGCVRLERPIGGDEFRGANPSGALDSLGWRPFRRSRLEAHLPFRWLMGNLLGENLLLINFDVSLDYVLRDLYALAAGGA